MWKIIDNNMWCRHRIEDKCTYFAQEHHKCIEDKCPISYTNYHKKYNRLKLRDRKLLEFDRKRVQEAWDKVIKEYYNEDV